MSEHTPGPWRKCGGYTPKFVAIDSNDGYIVFQMADHIVDKEHGKEIRAPEYETQQANARLIAASPELLAACKQAADLIHAVGEIPGHEAEAISVQIGLNLAIANAEGADNA